MADTEAEAVGSVVSPASGVVHVKASPRRVLLVRRGVVLLTLSPALARALGPLLARAADVADGR